MFTQRRLSRYSISRRQSTTPTSELIKPGIYGVPRSLTFAPNVTPSTYSESDDLAIDTVIDASLPPDAQLFPPSEYPQNPAVRRRVPPGKRRSLGYIPRPPNAFMLFRADFVRQKHVPGSIETNHGSLSKIIGNCWRSLPLEEKRIWEIKAKHEKEAHSKKYPGYRFRPVHNKNKAKKKDRPTPTPEDERRCEEVAQLLLEGMKGDELAAAIRRLDERKVVPPPQQSYLPRRPSSVPLPVNPIALPSLPFFAPTSRAGSPVHNISRSARMIIGQRRPSSALPHVGRSSWGVQDIPMFPTDLSQGFFPHSSSSLQRNTSPLPEVDTSLFEQTFLDSNFGFSTGASDPAMSFPDMFSNLPPHAPSQSYTMAPLDPRAFSFPAPSYSHLQTTFTNTNPASWSNAPIELTDSSPSSTYSGSPAHSDLNLPLIAPRPQHPNSYDLWPDVDVAALSMAAPAPVVPDLQGGKMPGGDVQGVSSMPFEHIGGVGVAVAGVDCVDALGGSGYGMFETDVVGFEGLAGF